jgi:hypothetical protein
MTRLTSAISSETLPSSAIASFRALSTEVQLAINNQAKLLRREGGLSRTYIFDSCAGNTTLFWKADGAISGDWKCVNKKGEVLVQFTNKWLSAKDVESFEVVGDIGDAEGLLDELVLSGLAALAMVQSTLLAKMVLVG